MKPLTNSPGPSPSPADQAENTGSDISLQPPLSARSPASGRPQSRTRSRSSTRLEDIVGVAPRSVRPVAPQNALPENFYRSLEHSLGAATSFAQALTAAARVLQTHASFSFVGCYTHDSAMIGQPLQITGLSGPVAELPEDSQARLIQLIERRQTPESDDRNTPPTAGTFARPIANSHTVLLGLAGPDGTSIHRSAFELATSQVSAWNLKQGLQESESDVRQVAAIVELVSHVSSCSSINEAARRISEDLCDYLAASRVYFGHCPTARAACRLVQVSGEEFDPLADSTVQAEAVLQEVIARNTPSTWPCDDPGNRHALLAHKRFCENTTSQILIACPLTTEDGSPVGALLVAWDTEQPSADGPMKFLAAAARPLSTIVESVHNSGQSMPARLWQRLRSGTRAQRLVAGVAFIAAVAGLSLIPVEYRVACESELQPVTRRFVAAPFDAPLDECLVEPGDVVEANQTLARLDGRELRWELAGVQADLGKATKEHNTFLSERRSGDAAIARHEMERLQNQAAVLLDRTRNLELRSPISGIVVTGDLTETEGVPLETGQSLFEIAPLDRMTVEIAIPEEDIRHVEAGMTVSLILDAMPSDTVNATIIRIHPRAELRDHENVFIADAEISNADYRLRPGMRGGVKVDTGTRALGWTLFHKPVAHVIGWLGW